MLTIDPDYPEVLAEIAHALYGALTERGTPHEEAQSMTFDLVEAVRKRIGGAQLYLPSGQSWDAAQKRKAIVAVLSESPGRYREIARNHGVSEQRVRQIEKEETARRRAQGGKKVAGTPVG